MSNRFLFMFFVCAWNWREERQKSEVNTQWDLPSSSRYSSSFVHTLENFLSPFCMTQFYEKEEIATHFVHNK